MKGRKYSIGSGPQRVVLAEYCSECNGKGNHIGYDSMGNFKPICENCDGYGFTVTEDGSQILALVNDVLFKGRK